MTTASAAGIPSTVSLVGGALVGEARDRHRYLGAVEKALLLIRHLCAEPEPCGLADLARTANLPKTTVHRLLGVLENEKVVRRTSLGYEVTDNQLRPVLSGHSDAELRSRALRGMLALYECTHLLVQLMVLEGNTIRCVDQFDATVAPVGEGALAQRTTWPALRTAAGKALLAVKDTGAHPARFTPHVAYDDGGTHHAWFTAAVPVLARDNLLAALSVTGPQAAVMQHDVRSVMAAIGRQCVRDRARV